MEVQVPVMARGFGSLDLMSQVAAMTRILGSLDLMSQVPVN